MSCFNIVFVSTLSLVNLIICLYLCSVFCNCAIRIMNVFNYFLILIIKIDFLFNIFIVFNFSFFLCLANWIANNNQYSYDCNKNQKTNKNLKNAEMVVDSRVELKCHATICVEWYTWNKLPWILWWVVIYNHSVVFRDSLVNNCFMVLDCRGRVNYCLMMDWGLFMKFVHNFWWYCLWITS